MGFIKEEKFMGKLKDRYMGFEDRYGWVVNIAIMMVSSYPELVKTRRLIKSISDDLPVLKGVEAPKLDAIQRAACKDELVVEICESIAKDFYSKDFQINKERADQVDWKELYRFMALEIKPNWNRK